MKKKCSKLENSSVLIAVTTAMHGPNATTPTAGLSMYRDSKCIAEKVMHEFTT